MVPRSVYNLTTKEKFERFKNRLRVAGSQKVFGIGFNKSGTTSLKVAMRDLGYVVGVEYHAKFLFDDWVSRNWSPIIEYCNSANFFQDSPFSLPHTFIAMDQAFPGSKFILTIRDDEEQWYHSLVSFHSKRWGNGNIPPTGEDLKKARSNVYTGRPYHTLLHIFDVDESDPYKKDVLINAYKEHRKSDLVIINVKNSSDYFALCDFLGKPPKSDSFPWENRT